MSAPTVYLAGPITGLDYAGAVDWRVQAVEFFKDNGIIAYSPMRYKSYLANVKEFTANGDAYRDLSVLSTNKGVMTRDRWDATCRDLLFVNVLKAPKVSVGTTMEVAWGDLARKPIVCAVEPKGNPHDHGMFMEAVGFRLPTLEEALHIAVALLKP